MKSTEQMRQHFARNISGLRRGSANHKTKFSRTMWDRWLQDQNEYAALRPVGIDVRETK